MLPPIDTHLCNRCKRLTTVWCFTIADGQMLQLCKECIVDFAHETMSTMNETTANKFLTKVLTSEN